LVKRVVERFYSPIEDDTYRLEIYRLSCLRLSVLECCIDLRVVASVKLPHLKSDLTTLGIALSRLIPLAELANIIVDCR